MKVAAYARVSTGSEEQYTSFKNQLSYFTEKIISEGNELIKLYADEGLTGTNFKRKGFIDMLYDAGIDFIKINDQEIFVLSDRAPLFDIIYVKSTSRLARNTDLMNIIKLLKTKNVDIYFDDLNKKASEVDAELLINLLIIFDEQFSNDLSRKTKFGFLESARKRPILTNILGYRRKDDDIVIIEDEANIVRKIFDMFVNDNIGTVKISKYLNEHGYRNRLGNEFTGNTVRNILNNEKYIGVYKFNEFNIIKKGNKKIKIPVDEDKQIIRENAFKAIIDKDTFNKAKIKLEKSKKGVRYNVSRYNRKIRCEACNCNYCRIHNGRFGCITKITKGKNSCKSKYIKPEDIDKFLTKTLKTFNVDMQAKINTFINILENYRDEFYGNNIDVKNQKNRLVDLYIKGKIDENIYTDKLNELLALENKNNIIDDINNEIRKLKNYNFVRKPQTTDELLDMITIYAKQNGELYYKTDLSERLRKLANRFMGFDKYYNKCVDEFNNLKKNS